MSLVIWIRTVMVDVNLVFEVNKARSSIIVGVVIVQIAMCVNATLKMLAVWIKVNFLMSLFLFGNVNVILAHLTSIMNLINFIDSIIQLRW